MVMFDLAWIMSKDLNDMLWYVSIIISHKGYKLNPVVKRSKILQNYLISA